MEIISRKEAKERGLKRYFTGKPCPKSHESQRFTSTAACVMCSHENRARWSKNNKDREKARMADYYLRTRELYLARKKIWRIGNPEIYRESSRRYRERNPDKLAAYARNRRARTARAEGSHTIEDVRKILASQKNKCATCKEYTKDGYHVDHIQPLARGGTNWPDNLQILCPSCNLSKGAKDPVQWANENGMLI